MFQNKSILIVEDEATVQQLLFEMIGKLEFDNIDIASDGSDALRHLDKASYDVILCDLMMEPMGGHEFLETLRAGITRFGPQKSATPVIFLTQSSDQSDVKKAKSSSVQGYLLKPIRFNDLKTRLMSVLKVHSVVH